MTPSFEPMRQSFLRKALRALLLWFLSPEQADWYSWHSFRVGLACALLAAGAPDSIILASCRWRSTASLRIYARLNREVYGQWLDNADGQSLSSVQGANLPQLPGSLPVANITALDARLKRTIFSTLFVTGSALRWIAHTCSYWRRAFRRSTRMAS